MMKIRPSIVHRKPRVWHEHHITEENQEKEYEKQVARLQHRRERREALFAQRRRDLFKSPNEKAAIMAEYDEAIRSMDETHATQEAEMARKDDWITADVNRHRAIAMQVEDMEAAARRAYMRNLSEENRKLAEYRQMLHMQQAEHDKVRERNAPDFAERWGRNAFT